MRRVDHRVSPRRKGKERPLARPDPGSPDADSSGETLPHDTSAGRGSPARKRPLDAGNALGEPAATVPSAPADPTPEGAAPAARAAAPQSLDWRGVAASALRDLAVLLLFLAGAWGVFRRAWQEPAHWIGGCCDPEQAMWFLRWTPYALRHGLDPFFTAHLNYPDGVNLMWNTSMYLPGLLLTPVSLAFGPIAAYNVFLLLAVALSAWCAYFALRRYTRGRLGAIVGGAVYGFSPYVISHAIAHANLTFVPVPPLILLVLDELVVRQRRSAGWMGFALGALAAVQLLITEEVLATAGIVAAILVLVLAAQAGRSAARRLPYLLRAAPWTVIVFLMISAAPLIEQFHGPERVTAQIYEPEPYATDLLNFVVPTEAQAIAPDVALKLAEHFSGLQHEANAYLGFPLLLLLAFIAGQYWERPVVRVAAVVTLIVAVLSMGSNLHLGGERSAIRLPWSLVDHLPLLNDVLTNRLTVFMYLGVGAMLAVFIDAARARRRFARRWPALLAVAVALVPLVPRLTFPTSTAPIPPIFIHWEESGVPAGSIVLVAPRATDGGGANQMLWQAVAGDAFAMPDGYFFIPGPDGHVILNTRPAPLFEQMDDIQENGNYPALDLTTRQQLARDLRSHAIDAIVVGPMDHRDLMLRYFTDLLGRDPDTVGGVALWRHVRQEGVVLGR